MHNLPPVSEPLRIPGSRVAATGPTRLLLFSSLGLALAGVPGCGGEDERPAEWGYISAAIIQPNCATSSCHGKGAAVAGLDLSTADEGYADLTKQKLPDPPKMTGTEPVVRGQPRPLVVPGNPEQSRVVNMLRARGAARMPPDRPLAEADIKLIEEWILSGAQP